MKLAKEILVHLTEDEEKNEIVIEHKLKKLDLWGARVLREKIFQYKIEHCKFGDIDNVDDGSGGDSGGFGGGGGIGMPPAKAALANLAMNSPKESS